MSELKPCPPSIENAITVLENEKQCVLRQIQIGGCDRNCVKCDLVMKDSEILEGYDTAIDALRRAQPANDPLTVEEMRQMEKSRAPVWMGRSKQWIFVASIADAPYAQVWYFTAKGMAQTVLYHHEIFYRQKPERSEG